MTFEIEVERLRRPARTSPAASRSAQQPRPARGVLPHAATTRGLHVRRHAARRSSCCHVPSLPLVPGSYYVELVMADGDGFIERVERADRLDVVFADVLGTGQHPEPQPGLRRAAVRVEASPRDEAGAGVETSRRRPDPGLLIATHANRPPQHERRRRRRGAGGVSAAHGAPAARARLADARRRRSGASDPNVERVRAAAGSARRDPARSCARKRIEADFAKYAATRPAGLELFSDDRTEHGDACSRQLPPCDVINLHWVAGLPRPRVVLPRRPARTSRSSGAWPTWRRCTGGCHYDQGCGTIRRAVRRVPAARLDATSTTCRARSGSASTTRLTACARPAAPRRHEPLDRRARRGAAACSAQFPITVIPNGLDVDDFAPRDKALRPRLARHPARRPVVLFAAESLGASRKGFALLARGARRACSDETRPAAAQRRRRQAGGRARPSRTCTSGGSTTTGSVARVQRGGRVRHPVAPGVVRPDGDRVARLRHAGRRLRHRRHPGHGPAGRDRPARRPSATPPPCGDAIVSVLRDPTGARAMSRELPADRGRGVLDGGAGRGVRPACTSRSSRARQPGRRVSHGPLGGGLWAR